MPRLLMGFSAAESNFLSRTAPPPTRARNCAEIDSNDPTLAIILKNVSQINRAPK